MFCQKNNCRIVLKSSTFGHLLIANVFAAFVACSLDSEFCNLRTAFGFSEINQEVRCAQGMSDLIGQANARCVHCTIQTLYVYELIFELEL